MPILPLNESDLEALPALQPPTWPDLIPRFQFYLQSPLCFPLSLIQNETLVAVGAAIMFPQTAWLGHIITHPSHQRQGLGTAMVRALVEWAQQKGTKTISLIATSAGEPVYQKVGFRSVGEYAFFDRVESMPVLPADRGLRLIKPADLPQVYEMDKAITGENRQALIEAHLADGWCYEQNGKLAGVYLKGVGEGPILAYEEEAGLALMRQKYAAEDKAILPAQNIRAIEFLKEIGFQPKKGTQKRMQIGPDLAWKPERIYGRTGGNLG